MEADCVVECADVLGECPVWSSARQQLFWLDLAQPRLHAFTPDDGVHTTRALSAPAPLGGLVATRHPDRLVLGSPAGMTLLDPDTLEEAPITGPPTGEPDLNYNDAGVDRAGRLWAATAETSESVPVATVVRFDGPEAETMDSGFIVANGPVFSAEGDLMFVSDSLGRRILAYDLDAGGRIVGKRVMAEFDAAMGYPDGLAVDEDRGLWVAHWDGGLVTRWSFEGERTAQITVPTRNVTNVAFGGAARDRLYITTASDGAGGGGNLYSAVPGVAGVPETLYIGQRE